LLPENILGTRSHRIPESPLCSYGRLQDVLQGSEFCEESIAILQYMQNLSDFGGVKEHRRSLQSASMLLSVETVGSDPYSLLRIVRLAAQIYIGAFKTPPVPFSSSLNRTAVKQLCRALEYEANDATWDCKSNFLGLISCSFMLRVVSSLDMS
jgi:hypothetical protein